MTAATIDRAPRPAPAGGTGRLLNVARLQLVAWQAGLLWPWGILGIAFVINLVLFAVLAGQDVEDSTTGGISSIFFVMIIAAYQTVTKDFSFALSMGVTRRRFALATAAFAVAQAVTYALVLELLRLVEVATGGWGIDLAFFGPAFMEVGNPAGQWLVYVAYFLFVAGLGYLLGAVVKRWAATGTMMLLAGSIVVVGLTATLATYLSWWGPLGRFFGDLPEVVAFAGGPAVLGLVTSVAAYGILRRTSP